MIIQELLKALMCNFLLELFYIRNWTIILQIEAQLNPKSKVLKQDIQNSLVQQSHLKGAETTKRNIYLLNIIHTRRQSNSFRTK